MQQVTGLIVLNCRTRSFNWAKKDMEQEVCRGNVCRIPVRPWSDPDHATLYVMTGRRLIAVQIEQNKPSDSPVGQAMPCIYGHRNIRVLSLSQVPIRSGTLNKVDEETQVVTNARL